MTGTQYALNQTSDNEDLPGIVQLPAYAKYDGRLLVILGSSGEANILLSFAETSPADAQDRQIKQEHHGHDHVTYRHGSIWNVSKTMNMTPTLMADDRQNLGGRRIEPGFGRAGIVRVGRNVRPRPARRMKPSAAHNDGRHQRHDRRHRQLQNSPSFQPYRMTAHVISRDGRPTPNVAEAPKNHSRPLFRRPPWEARISSSATISSPHSIKSDAYACHLNYGTQRVNPDNMLSNDRMTGIGYPSMPQGAVDAYPIDRCFYMRADMCRSFASACTHSYITTSN